jgi:hypothetical protein
VEILVSAGTITARIPDMKDTARKAFVATVIVVTVVGRARARW